MKKSQAFNCFINQILIDNLIKYCIKLIKFRLILPCICNAIIFLIGQVVVTIGISEGRWTIWFILVLFALTASTDSVTLLIFSSTVRFPFFFLNYWTIICFSSFLYSTNDWMNNHIMYFTRGSPLISRFTNINKINNP